MTSTLSTPTRTVSQTIGLVFGAVYVLIGLVGFAITSGVGFADTHGKDLVFFEINPLHNLVHIAIGVALIWAARAGANASRVVNATIGSVYLLVGVVGLFVLNSSANILALNHPDNVLHLLSAAILIGAGMSKR